jgi:3-oxoacyl-[acyl-carrier protein] reductase
VWCRKARALSNHLEQEVRRMAGAANRSAIVTGASRGIGAAIARRLAHDGIAVAVNFSGDPTPAQEVVAAIQADGGHAIAIKADVSNPAAMRALFQQTADAFGGVDILVNNAGIMRLATIAEADDALFDQQIAINLKGVFNGLREATKHLRDGGRIINFSSSVVGLYPPTYAVYAATKAGIEAMTQIMSKELRGRSITVNAIAPGPTATDLFLRGKSEETIAQMAKQALLERLGEPDDIANAVAFLAGPDAAWVNGQVLRANGGII